MIHTRAAMILDSPAKRNPLFPLVGLAMPEDVRSSRERNKIKLSYS
jgi:hypothetical protein